jgi:hypothetical protein
MAFTSGWPGKKYFTDKPRGASFSLYRPSRNMKKLYAFSLDQRQSRKGKERRALSDPP